MKLYSSKTHSGSVLVAAMIFVLAIAFFLFSYLWLVQNSNQSVARAQRWNSALSMAESGIEEGLANLNSQVTISSTNMAVNFSPSAILSNNLSIGGNASYSGSYSATNYSANGLTSRIVSTGFVPSPTTGDPISRTVVIESKRNNLLTKGIVAMHGLDLSGSGGDPIVNSYDSRLGQYNPNNYLNGGGVAVMNGSLNLANHEIAGDVYLGDNATLTKGPNAIITGVTNSGWAEQYPNAALPAKDTNGNILPLMWPDAPGNSNSHTFTNSGYYTIRDTGDLIVKPGVIVNLDVKISNFDYSKNNQTIDIQGGTANAGTLIIYQESGTAAFGAQNTGGAISNQPINFQYFGMTNVTAIDINGGSTVFQGVIYAPQATLTLNGGGGAQDNDFMGGFVVGVLADKGHYRIHYDQSLKGVYYGFFVVGFWQELKPNGDPY